MISAFVISYGYLAVFLGTLLEGETILLSAGFAANRGLLYWPLVVAVAFAGATLGDQIAFLLGRWQGASLIARFPRWRCARPGCTPCSNATTCCSYSRCVFCTACASPAP